MKAANSLRVTSCTEMANGVLISTGIGRLRDVRSLLFPTPGMAPITNRPGGSIAIWGQWGQAPPFARGSLKIRGEVGAEKDFVSCAKAGNAAKIGLPIKKRTRDKYRNRLFKGFLLAMERPNIWGSRRLEHTKNERLGLSPL